MYEVEIKKSAESDISDDELDFKINDLVSAIELNLSDDSTIKRDKYKLIIESSMDEKELKDSLEPAFEYYFNDIRFVSLTHY